MTATANAIPIEFVAAEIQIAYLVASQREWMALKKSLENGRGTPPGFFPELHIRGALGEVAAARAFNLCWGNHAKFRGIDVGGLIEVRACSESRHKLLVHTDDKDDKPFVLVDLSGFPTASVVGWIDPADAKQESWFGQPPGLRQPAFLVPRPALRPCHELKTRLLDRLT